MRYLFIEANILRNLFIIFSSIRYRDIAKRWKLQVIILQWIFIYKRY